MYPKAWFSLCGLCWFSFISYSSTSAVSLSPLILFIDCFMVVNTCSRVLTLHSQWVQVCFWCVSVLLLAKRSFKPSICVALPPLWRHQCDLLAGVLSMRPLTSSWGIVFCVTCDLAMTLPLLDTALETSKQMCASWFWNWEINWSTLKNMRVYDDRESACVRACVRAIQPNHPYHDSIFQSWNPFLVPTLLFHAPT